MKLWVDDRLTAPDVVTNNTGLNYRRFNRGNIEVHSYVFMVERKELIERFSKRYRETVEDVRLDDEQYDDDSPFKEMGYVQLPEAFDYPALLADAVDTFFACEIFGVFLQTDAPNKYVINSTDQVEVSSESLLIRGRCFRHRRPTGT